MAKREIKNELLEKLLYLKNEEKKYDFIKNFSSSTIEDFNAFVKANEPAFNELKALKEQIELLELALMSGPEKEAYIEYLNKLKDKFTGEK